MIKVENIEVVGWEHAIRGMRNPMNSWYKSDSGICKGGADGIGCDNCCEQPICEHSFDNTFKLGNNDHNLMMKLANGGPVHAKYRRMIVVYMDITAPLYWWKEFDTYKVGTVANSCSTMHKIHSKEFTLDDFSYEHLDIRTKVIMEDIIKALNDYRKLYINYNPDDFEIKGCPDKKLIWWQMIQLLPSSYNQKRTVMMNYEVLQNLYKHRLNHKLDEWNDLCEVIKDLPYSEIFINE